MSQLPSQTLIAILQLVVTAFQFVFMIFISSRPKVPDRHGVQDEEDLRTVSQSARSNDPIINRGLNIELSPLPSTYLGPDSSQGNEERRRVLQAPSQPSGDPPSSNPLNHSHLEQLELSRMTPDVVMSRPMRP
ncbi:hypothetical protein F5Y12DRAFT_309942 [Xylaria sp. FL1777]|nr:hypothetical protein F5Y12DRAFT_309942 [Xylaria sp. FL1777]